MSDKFVRFTESARDALAMAQGEARRLGYGYVGCEHLLLGLMREQMGMGGIILRSVGVDHEALRRLIPRIAAAAAPEKAPSRLDLSPGCKRAINRAVQEAQVLGHPLVSTEHLLMGLMAQPEGTAARLLIRLGVTPRQVDARIQQALENGISAVSTPSKVGRPAFEDRYKVESLIGVGSMSSVYRARDLRFTNVVKLVAIKEMVVDVKDPETRSQMIRNFRQEAAILAALKHPFIPRFYDFFSIEDRFYIVMEYIVGQDLETIMGDTEGLFPMLQVVDWGIQLCDVLTYLHTHPSGPVVFRDLKPSNIMIDRHGNVRLIDFNVARVLEGGRKRARAGTPGYAAPEQYTGIVSPLVDIYALGATLHHLLTGVDPRLHPSFTFDRRPLRTLRPSSPPELDALVHRALAYNPDQRFSSAASMKAELMAVREIVAADSV